METNALNLAARRLREAAHGAIGRLLRFAFNADRLALYAGVLALVPMLAVVGQYTVPSHWTSIWMDQEFSGWVAPIANRLASGQQLYADGAHSPMAPLSYVLTYWLSGGRALWITDSALNYAGLSLAVMTLYLGFHRVLPWPAPLVAAFGTAVSFVSLPKLMAYDSLAQLFAAMSAVLAMHGLRGAPGDRSSRVYLSLAGAASALCFLSKQSTGTGVVVGVVLALWFSRGTGGPKQRLLSTTRYGASAAFMCIAVLLVLSPWIDVSGFVRDVLLTSTEAKGGRAVLLSNLRGFGVQIWNQALTLAVPPLVIPIALLAWRAFETRQLDPKFSSQSNWPVLPSVLGGLVGSTVYALVVVKLGLGYPDVLLQSLLYLSIAGLVAARLRSRPSPHWVTALAIFAGVAFPTAIAHSLSVDQFRWTYDNNPLIWVPLAFSASVVVQGAALPSRASRAAVGAAALAFAAQVIAGGGFSLQWHRAEEANRPWPEVHFLKGAFLRPSADGMRVLVAVVRELAPSEADTVLLFPNDPNVEAWFERPRPFLSSSIVFADQYWDRYVDQDFDRLTRHPPRVIVLGPRNFWKGFSHIWQPGRATERLGLRVVNELIPKRYRHARDIAIHFGNGDFMDVYVLNEPAGVHMGSGANSP